MPTPLLGTVSLPIKPRAPGVCHTPLLGHQVHGGVWEIVYPACMIEIQVGQDDVTHIAAPESQPFNLPDCCQIGAELRRDQCQEEPAQTGMRSAHVMRAEAGVYQDQAVIGLD